MSWTTLLSLLAVSFEGIGSSSNLPQAFASGLSKLQALLKLQEYQPPAPVPEYPYFAIIPPYLGTAYLGQSTVISAPCFPNATWKVSQMNSNGSIPVHVSTGAASSRTCSETFLVGTLTGVTDIKLPSAGEYDFLFPSQWLNTSSTSHLWDLTKNGIRVFREPVTGEEFLYDLEQTLLLFKDYAQPSTSAEGMAANLAFLGSYANKQMYPRTTTSPEIDPNMIQSGDFFGLIRLDGLDPMLSWAMGSATGHTAVALRAPNNTLYVCESTTNSSYWPVNGVQCTEFGLWRALERNATYHVTYGPLSPKYRALFNATAAWNYFYTVQGFDYGYENFLFGWIDTISSNFPCVPPDFKVCLQKEHVDMIFGWVDAVDPTLANRFVKQALNQRLGTNLTSIPDIFYAASQRGISSAELNTIPENDKWVYQTTRYGVPAAGPAMVCCTFVCQIWKHSGIFDSIGQEVNCGELTNWDDSALDLFDIDYTSRPQSCISADPENPCCQLEGPYTLILNDYNSREPYPHMGETCESMNPYYVKHAGC